MGDFFVGVGSGLLIAFLGFMASEFLKKRWLRQSISRALLAEATAARENHMNVIGRHLDETPDNTLPAQRALIGSQHPFPIFHQLSVHLGIFPKEDAQQLAQGYSEAMGFVNSLKLFLDRMERLDELTIAMHRADAIAEVRTVAELRREWEILNQMQIQFFGYIKSRNRRITGEVFNQIKEILEKY